MNTVPRNVKSLTGRKFGKLTVIAFIEIAYQPCGLAYARWECECECGKHTVVSRANLKDGTTKSCGCLRREAGRHTTKHGAWATVFDPAVRSIYLSWKSMKARCDNPNATGYRNYGGRGITYDKTWQDFRNFLKDMRQTHQSGLSLERKNVNGIYCKANCIWATALEQNNNTRVNFVIECNGIHRTLSQWSKLTKISRTTIRNRLKSGWSIRSALEFEEDRRW